MIDQDSVEAVVEQYRRFGWQLRQIVVTDTWLLASLTKNFGESIARTGDMDAAWFSRTNRGSETWELRRLSGGPFALVRVIDVDLPIDERDKMLREVELQMAGTPEKHIGEIPLEK